MGALDWLAAVLIGVGILFFVAGTLGLIRLPDPVSRLHALTKADNLGLLFLTLGLVLNAPDVFYGVKLILVWLLVLAAGATGAHLIAQRTLRDDREDAI
jgi:multicomponent Na+:H+ antiporter subunit G